MIARGALCQPGHSIDRAPRTVGRDLSRRTPPTPKRKPGERLPVGWRSYL